MGFAQAEPLKLRFAWVAPLSDWASIWLDKKDLARNYGKSYVVESVRYRGTPTMITAIASNELEIGALARFRRQNCIALHQLPDQFAEAREMHLCAWNCRQLRQVRSADIATISPAHSSTTAIPVADLVADLRRGVYGE